MLDLAFSEEQEMLREAVGSLCDDKASVADVRRLENDSKGFDDEFWSQLSGLGITAALIPEQYGGAGMSMLDTVVVYEEFGRSLAPSPHLVSCVVAAGVLSRCGSDEQKTAWLPMLASGESILGVAWLEPDNSSGPSGIQLTAVCNDGVWTLSGVKRHTFFASSADALLVPARTAHGIDLFLVGTDAAGVSLDQQRSIAYDTQYRVDFANVRVDESARLGEPGQGWEPWQAAMLDACILTGAQAASGARRVHEIATEYAKERVQFDKPLAAFQSISHYLADGITEVDGATLLVHQAAWARDAERDVERLAPMAKLFATEVFRRVSGLAIQIHGGMGFTVECDAQLFFRRAKSLELNWFDTPRLEEMIAVEVLDR